jgi:hypothetical protein
MLRASCVSPFRGNNWRNWRRGVLDCRGSSKNSLAQTTQKEAPMMITIRYYEGRFWVDVPGVGEYGFDKLVKAEAYCAKRYPGVSIRRVELRREPVHGLTRA